MNALLENGRKSRKRLNTSAGIVITSHVDSRENDGRENADPPTRSASVPDHASAEVRHRRIWNSQQEGNCEHWREKKKYAKAWHEKGDAKGRQAVMNAPEKRTQGVPDVKSS